MDRARIRKVLAKVHYFLKLLDYDIQINVRLENIIFVLQSNSSIGNNNDDAEIGTAGRLFVFYGAERNTKLINLPTTATTSIIILFELQACNIQSCPSITHKS